MRLGLILLSLLLAGCVEPTREDGGAEDGVGVVRIGVTNDGDAPINFVARSDANPSSSQSGSLDVGATDYVELSLPIGEQNLEIALVNDDRASAGLFVDVDDVCTTTFTARWDGERWEFDQLGGSC